MYLALLIAACIADIYTSKLVKDAGGAEKNPLARALMAKIGWMPAALVLKAAIVGAALLIDNPGAWVVFIGLNLAVAVWNFLQFKKAPK